MRFLPGHLSYEKLVARVTEEVVLTPRETSHLEACGHCRRNVGTLGKMLRLLRSKEEQSVSPETFAWAWQAFRSHAAPPQESMVQKIVAVLSAELSPLSPAFGERSAEVGPAGEDWQRLYHAGAYDLDVRVEPTGDKCTVSGQVLGPCDTGEVELKSQSVSLRARLDDFASFFLPPVPHGAYTLFLRWPGMEIKVPDLVM
jgi:hypothetical protein